MLMFSYLFIILAGIIFCIVFAIKTLTSGHSAGCREELTTDSSLSNVSHTVPYTMDLTHPAELPHFSEIAESGHTDQRAIIYTLLSLDTQRKRIFSDKKLNAQDFENSGKVHQILVDKGLIQEPDQNTTLVSIYTKAELKNVLLERGLPVTGNKKELAERLLNSGFLIEEKDYRHKLFELTENGISTIREYHSEEKEAILFAINALKKLNFSEAVSAFCDFDRKWGFVHISEKKHTIFSNYNIPFRRFEFIANYPMSELNNSEDFKNALRACIIAGTMSKHKERWEIASYFKDVCCEQIQWPNILDYYRTGEFYDMGARENILAAMQRNIEADNRYVLEYYISWVKFLSKQSS